MSYRRRAGELVVTYHWLQKRPGLEQYSDKNARDNDVPALATYLEAPEDGLKLWYVDLASDGGMSRVIWVSEELAERREPPSTGFM